MGYEFLYRNTPDFIRNQRRIAWGGASENP